MFKLVVSPAYWWPVHVSLPAAGEAVGGVVEKADFEVEFIRMGEEQFLKLAQETSEGRIGDRDLVPRVIRNFRHVQDDTGASLPYSTANLATLLDVPGVASAIVAAFFASRHPAAEKN
jgi:hypothetical protein